MTRTLPTMGLVAVALIAGFAVSSPTASLLDAVSNPTGDKDKDNVPDETEKLLCGREAVRSLIIAQAPLLGRCSGNDWTPARTIVTIELPSDYKKGVDYDADGFPAKIDIVFTKYDINPFRAQVVIPSTAAPVSVPVDDLFSDNDASLPVLTRLDTGVDVPVMVLQGDDKDFDGLPAQLTLKMSRVMYDRTKATPVALDPKADQKVQFDTNDADANEPVRSIVTAPVLVDAWHDGDADGDYLPHALKFTWKDVTIDRRSATTAPKIVDRKESLIVDTNDASRSSHIPFDLIDKDGDVYPDEVEKVICMVQDEFDDADGKCVRSDGSGNDGDGDNFIAPKDVPNPWKIGQQT